MLAWFFQIVVNNNNTDSYYVCRKLRATLDEYTTRVGQQAIVLCISPSKPNPVFRVFGAAPLENVVSIFTLHFLFIAFALIWPLFCFDVLWSGEEIQKHDSGGSGKRPGWTCAPWWWGTHLWIASTDYWRHTSVCWQDDTGGHQVALWARNFLLCHANELFLDSCSSI